jgi:acetyl esterase/lipase
VIAGDSAGATLTVQTLILARDAGLPMPAAAVLFSPFTDATVSGRSMTTKHGIDPLFTRADLEWFCSTTRCRNGRCGAPAAQRAPGSRG